MPLDCVVVMARRPEAGIVKTRLAASLGAAAAARLYEAFLLDTLRTCAALDAALLISYAPDEPAAHSYFAAVAPSALLAPQRDSTFGARLAEAMQAGFEAGYRRVAVVGSDTPHLSPADVEAAFSALDVSDVALGPTLDGGYYLLALKAPEPRLFEDIEWSSGRELAQTFDRTALLELSVTVLGETFDIDVEADLDALRRSIPAHGPAICPHTARAIAELGTPAGARRGADASVS